MPPPEEIASPAGEQRIIETPGGRAAWPGRRGWSGVGDGDGEAGELSYSP